MAPDAAAVVARLAFDDAGLIPAVVQDHDSREVLMVAWMDAAAVTATLAEGRTVFWSRSRGEVWRKGDTSGDVQHVRRVLVDCDRDTLLVQVDQHGGGACHTGAPTCFFRTVDDLVDAADTPDTAETVDTASPSSSPPSAQAPPAPRHDAPRPATTATARSQDADR